MNTAALKTTLIALLLASLSGWATADNKSLEEAAKKAARQDNTKKVLSAKTVRQGSNNVHKVRVLTNDGVVRTMRMPAPKGALPNIARPSGQNNSQSKPK